jgi:hypothetical protein
MYVNANTFLAETPIGVVTCPPFTSSRDVIDNRIDVFAQYALLRMFKGDPAARADAQGMLCAVKTGQLAGIYKEDERVPALRARKINRWWWQIIPPGEDATVVSDPLDPLMGAPVIIFRDSVRSKPFRLDPSLGKAYRVFETFQNLRQQTCPSTEHVAFGEPSTGSEELPDDSCKLITCFATEKINKAVCNFKARLKNPWLVCWGQSYWALLAKRALENAKEKEVKCTKGQTTKKLRGATLQRELRSSYLEVKRQFLEPWPKSPLDLWHWFLQKKEKLNWCDQEALRAISRDECCNTVEFVMKVLEQQNPSRGIDTLGHVVTEAMIDRVQHDDQKGCLMFSGSRLKNIIQSLKATLDAGYFVQAGVYPTYKACKLLLIPALLRHYVLIIGHDNANQFVYWNTVGEQQNSIHGGRFGFLEYDGQRLATQSLNYQVVYLNSKISKSHCYSR